MNERIKQLKKQAWEYAMAVHDGLVVPPLNKEVWPIDKVLDEKFAELIVQECVDIAYKFDEPKLSGPGMIIGNRIEEHFGVEE